MNILGISTNNFSQSSFCFICLTDKGPLIRVQQTEYDNGTLLEMMRYLSFDISCIESGIPMFVCRTCHKRLRVAYDLKVLWAKNNTIVKRYLFYLKHFTHPSTFNISQPKVQHHPSHREQSPAIDIKKLEEDEVITVEVDLRDSDDDSDLVSAALDKHIESTKHKTVPCETSNCLQVISRAIHQSEVYKSPVLSNRPEFNNGYRNSEHLKSSNISQTCSRCSYKPNISGFVSAANQFSNCSYASDELNDCEVSETVGPVYCATDNTHEYSKINIISSVAGKARILSNRPEFNIYRKTDSRELPNSQNTTKDNNDFNVSEQSIKEHDNNRTSFNTISNEIPLANTSVEPKLPTADNEKVETMPILSEEITKTVIDHNSTCANEDSGVDSPVSATSSTDISLKDIADNSKSESEESKVCKKRKFDENLDDAETNLKKKPNLNSETINDSSQESEQETSVTIDNQKTVKNINRKQNKVRPPTEAVDLDIFSTVKLRNRMKLSYNCVQTHQQYNTRSLRKPKVPKKIYNIKRDRRAIVRMNSCRIVLHRITEMPINNDNIPLENDECASESNETNDTQAEHIDLNIISSETTDQNIEITPEMFETANTLAVTSENSVTVDGKLPVMSTSKETHSLELKNSIIDHVDIEIKEEIIDMDNNFEIPVQDNDSTVLSSQEGQLLDVTDHKDLVMKEEIIETDSNLDSDVERNNDSTLVANNEEHSLANDGEVKQEILDDADDDTGSIDSSSTANHIETSLINTESGDILNTNNENEEDLTNTDCNDDDNTNAGKSAEELKSEEREIEQKFLVSIKTEEEHTISSNLANAGKNCELVKSETTNEDLIIVVSNTESSVSSSLNDTGVKSSTNTDEDSIKSEENSDTVVYSFTNAEFLTESENSAEDLIKSESDINSDNSKHLSAVEQNHSQAVTDTVGTPVGTRLVDTQLEVLDLSVTTASLNSNASVGTKQLKVSGKFVADDNLNSKTSNDSTVSNTRSELVIDTTSPSAVATDMSVLQASTSCETHPANNPIPTDASKDNVNIPMVKSNKHTSDTNKSAPLSSTSKYTLTPELKKNLTMLSQIKLYDSVGKPVQMQPTASTPVPRNQIVPSSNRETDNCRFSKVITAVDSSELLRYVGHRDPVESRDNTTKLASIIPPPVPFTSNMAVPYPAVTVGSTETTNLNSAANQLTFDSLILQSMNQQCETPINASSVHFVSKEQEAVGSSDKPTSHLRVKQLHTMQQAVHRRAGSHVKTATATSFYRPSIATTNANNDYYSIPSLVPLESALELFTGTGTPTTVPSYACCQETRYSSTSLCGNDRTTSNLIHLGTSSPRNLIPSTSVYRNSCSSGENAKHFESPQQGKVPASVGSHERASTSLLTLNLENLSLTTSTGTCEHRSGLTLSPAQLESPKEHSSNTSGSIESTTTKLSHLQTTTYQENVSSSVITESNISSQDLDKDQVQNRDKVKKNTKHQCPTCNKLCSSAYILKKHALTHKNFYQCRLCSEKFVMKASFKTHMLKHYGDNTTCDICNKVLKSKNSLKSHHDRCHSNSGRCKKCNITFTSKEEYKLHMKNEHPYVQKTCPFCSKVFTIVEYKKHILSHGNAYKCELCKKDFASKLTLNRHNCIENFEKEFKCTKCDVEFYFERHLMKHMVTHTENYLKCPSCMQTFDSKSSLKEHTCVYVKEYQCTACTRKFYFELNLKTHMLTHLKEDFECKQNDKCFTNTPSL